MKHFFKNKKGMTYVELLVAFTLLVLVITVFSPMLLSSYSTLYNAGEKNVDTYKAKSSIEDELAYRNSNDVIYNMQANFKELGEMAKVNVRRVTESAAQGVASTYNGLLSTLYYNGKGYIRLISSTHINDDTNTKTFVFQTSGFRVDSVVYGGSAARTKVIVDGKETYKYTVKLLLFKPDKTADLQETVYSKAIEDGGDDDLIDVDTSALADGIIRLTTKGVDITDSPLKIELEYYDENNQLQKISSFIYIESPTIILGGETGSGAEYYTSAGLTESKYLIKDADGKVIGEGINTTLDIDGRDMTDITYPAGTVIKNVSWIDNDTTSQSGGFKKYYVLTGTNGAIYRLYSATDEASYNKIKTLGISADKAYSITDSSLRRMVYPVGWGGDYSHEYKFSSYYHALGYGEQEDRGDFDNCWITENSADVYGTQAKYTYYYNGNNTEFYFKFQNGRTISYILTEYGEPLRCFGEKKQKDDYKKYTSVWDTRYSAEGTWKNYESNGRHWQRSNTELSPFYGYPKEDSNHFSEGDFSQLRIKALQSFDKQSELFEDFDKDKAEKYGNASANYNRFSSDANPTDLTVTDAVYMPELGKVLYLGSKSAYVYLRQQDAYDKTNATYYALDEVDSGLTGSDRYKTRKANKPTAYFTGYYIAGDSSATGGSIIRKVYSQSTDFDNLTKTFKSLTGLNTVEKSSDGKDIVLTANSDAASKFFVDRINHCYRFSDVEFTLGYASDRSMVFNHITYDGTNENYKSYENLYFKSHYSDGATANSDGTSSHSTTVSPTNSADNDYYNVWFPGECYNMIKVATKEGVTVGIGYAVSGSVYQHITPKAAGTYNSFSWSDVGRGSLFSFNTVQKTISANTVFNTSTSLGGVFNDGILGVSINGSAFTNVLYFKDNATMNSNYLTNGSGVTDQSAYKNAFTTYGTHARNSIQFTAVDLLVEGGADSEDGGDVSSVTSDTKTYTAFYGDNTGRVFKSLVATAKVEYLGTDDDGNPIYNKTGGPQAVGYIADTTYSGTATPPSRMEEVKLNNGQSLSTVFSKITNIVCEGSTVIISGTRNASVTSPKSYVVVGKKSDDGTWVWLNLEIASASYIINDATISNGVYYACGETGSDGFFMAVDLADIDKAIADLTDEDTSNNRTDITDSAKIQTKMRTPSTAIGGAATTKLPKLYSIDCKGSGTD